MSEIDSKQHKLIVSWFARAIGPENDAYAQFMFLWISFNAYCYALFAAEANRPRANLRKDEGLSFASDTPTSLSGIIKKNGAKVSIEINQPGRIAIDLAEKYTEDIIFSRFAKAHQKSYEQWQEEPEFVAGIVTLQEALNKPGRGHFVINMARIDDYPSDDQTITQNDMKLLVQRNVVVPFEGTKGLLGLVDVLYQIRCNIFHGEKLPGQLNDDYVVKAALPPLRIIMSHLLAAIGSSES